MELHQSHLRQVLDRLAKAGLTLRGTKCKLGLDKVQYLGHVFSKEGMTPDSEKITVMQKWPTPTNATEVRQFLGLASYYRRYVNNFADVAAPLHSLTQKAVEFSWDENCQHAFQMLKVALTQAPVLSYPSFKKEFMLLTDASAVGIGAVLEQEGHPIAYASRSLTPSERQYSVIERECLAAVFAVKQFVPGPLEEVITVPVMTSLQLEILRSCHDIISAGHQGTGKTLDRLKRVAYWVGMAKATELYCRSCESWESISTSPSRFFTKWAEAIPMPDQTAERIVRVLIEVFSHFGIPEILHSDQGRNFESTILKKTCSAFGIVKSRTTSYHPQEDGVVERFNRTLLQLLRAYVQQQSDWESQLPLLLYAYRTARHTSTHLSPFVLLMGREPVLPITPSLGGDEMKGQDPHSYEHTLQVRLAELRDLVECHIAQEAQRQKKSYDSSTKCRTFNVGDAVWLHVPTAGKLEAKWEGGWTVRRVLSPVNVDIEHTTTARTRVVHVNRLQARIVREEVEAQGDKYEEHGVADWEAPQIEHLILPPQQEQPAAVQRRYPQRIRHPVLRYN
ncbi:hypothetical protein EMCRGX_G024787 [Ephydatia muelleri]